MRYFKRCLRFVTIPALSVLLIANTAKATLVVIGNNNVKTTSLTAAQLTNLYLGKTSSIDGQTIAAYNQPSNSNTYANFYHSILGWSVEQVSGYWTQKVFSGEGSQPADVGSGRAAIDFVAKTPGAIAYVDSSTLSRSGLLGEVKVLYGQAKSLDYGRNLTSQRPHNQMRRSRSVRQSTGAVDLSQSTGNLYVQQSQSSGRPDVTPQAIQTHTAYYQTPFVDPDKNLWLNMIKHFQLTRDYDHFQVRRQVDWFLAHRDTLNVMIRNSIPYIAYIYQRALAQKVPAEFALLPMLESGYNPYAYSRVGAAGLWQMMPQTATLYGLTISWWYDARRDVLLSTRASLSFMSNLDHQFGSWLLAAAAYNAGGGTVGRAVSRNHREGLSTTFWNLSLPEETRAYVPKLLALADIVSHATQYHVELPPLTSKPFFTSVTIRSQMTLPVMSKLAGVSINLIHYLNPGLRRYATNPDGNYTLLIPTVIVPKFKQQARQLEGKSYESWQYHEVYPGETLAKIAHDYHTSASLLQKVNQLADQSLVTGQGILVPVYLGKKYLSIAAVGIDKQVARIGKISAEDILSGRLKVMKNKNPDINLTEPVTPKQHVAQPGPPTTFQPLDKVDYNPHVALRQLLIWVFYNINLLH